MQNKILITSFGLAAIAVSIVVAFFAMQRTDRYLELKAIRDCAETYRVEVADEKSGKTTIRPLEDPYRECVWNKGVKSWQGTK
ncbi:MAG TPA: hypothetical protein VJC10_00760 [Patescibacteria group bacterium]|nr:hypothetical protein [Patescibacteria group bacterium]